MKLLNRSRVHALRVFGSRLGLDIHAWEKSIEARRGRLLRVVDPACVLDVGANTGQYVADLRWGGYAGPVASFEPTAEAFQQLQLAADQQPNWQPHPFALGAADGFATISVAQESIYSSMHVPTSEMAIASNSNIGNRAQVVAVRSLDSWIRESQWLGERIAIKLDVQGAEEDVLSGASDTLPYVDYLEVELPLRAVYEGQWDLTVALQRIQEWGFTPVLTENLMPAPDGAACLQANFIFVRQETISR